MDTHSGAHCRNRAERELEESVSVVLIKCFASAARKEEEWSGRPELVLLAALAEVRIFPIPKLPESSLEVLNWLQIIYFEMRPIFTTRAAKQFVIYKSY